MRKELGGKKSLLLGDFEGETGERLHAGHFLHMRLLMIY